MMSFCETALDFPLLFCTSSALSISSLIVMSIKSKLSNIKCRSVSRFPGTVVYLSVLVNKSLESISKLVRLKRLIKIYLLLIFFFLYRSIKIIDEDCYFIHQIFGICCDCRYEMTNICQVKAKSLVLTLSLPRQVNKSRIPSPRHYEEWVLVLDDPIGSYFSESQDIRLNYRFIF